MNGLRLLRSLMDCIKGAAYKDKIKGQPVLKGGEIYFPKGVQTLHVVCFIHTSFALFPTQFCWPLFFWCLSWELSSNGYTRNPGPCPARWGPCFGKGGGKTGDRTEPPKKPETVTEKGANWGVGPDMCIYTGCDWEACLPLWWQKHWLCVWVSLACSLRLSGGKCVIRTWIVSV